MKCILFGNEKKPDICKGKSGITGNYSFVFFVCKEEIKEEIRS